MLGLHKICLSRTEHLQFRKSLIYVGKWWNNIIGGLKSPLLENLVNFVQQITFFTLCMICIQKQNSGKWLINHFRCACCFGKTCVQDWLTVFLTIQVFSVYRSRTRVSGWLTMSVRNSTWRRRITSASVLWTQKNKGWGTFSVFNIWPAGFKSLFPWWRDMLFFRPFIDFSRWNNFHVISWLIIHERQY